MQHPGNAPAILSRLNVQAPTPVCAACRTGTFIDGAAFQRHRKNLCVAMNTIKMGSSLQGTAMISVFSDPEKLRTVDGLPPESSGRGKSLNSW